MWLQWRPAQSFLVTKSQTEEVRTMWGGPGTEYWGGTETEREQVGRRETGSEKHREQRWRDRQTLTEWGGEKEKWRNEERDHFWNKKQLRGSIFATNIGRKQLSNNEDSLFHIFTLRTLQVYNDCWFPAISNKSPDSRKLLSSPDQHENGQCKRHAQTRRDPCHLREPRGYQNQEPTICHCKFVE